MFCVIWSKDNSCVTAGFHKRYQNFSRTFHLRMTQHYYTYILQQLLLFVAQFEYQSNHEESQKTMLVYFNKGKAAGCMQNFASAKIFVYYVQPCHRLLYFLVIFLFRELKYLVHYHGLFLQSSKCPTKLQGYSDRSC